ncbi:uncharacterized protein F4807DRAFT_408820 [Annulohypoxylon truncatum]|uniref:uncharacterized protein n=1 Tax=Annulohypoxylon truncatum TaxID=327061 RepID=UPI002008B0AB|nr:uncharacterized protein F4807DRAFT_408820 [Annulohypoxylon truncatum]KAI1213719.1 hypothetical protein F4807DRAFT_408820 [Annulohypoxylon truncatum]
MAPQQKFQITSGSKEYINRTIQVLTPAFQNDPVFAWLLHNYPLSKHQSVLAKLFRAFFTQASLNKAIFIEVDDFSCCSVLIPPGASLDNPRTLLRAGLIPALFTIGPGSFKRSMFEYSSGAEPMIEKALTKEEQKNHWYVFIMGTAVDRRRQGFASSLLVHMQERATSDGRPLWLEATTPNSRNLYSKHGFVTVGEVVLGKGKVGPDGLARKGGQGITIWSMYWRPSS